MNGGISIGSRRVGERWLWVLLGAVGTLSGVNFMIAMLVTLRPVLGVVALVALAGLALLARQRRSDALARLWALLAWAMLSVSAPTLLVAGSLIPGMGPGAGLPTGGAALPVLVSGIAIVEAVSVLVAVAAFEVARRWLARPVPQAAAA